MIYPVFNYYTHFYKSEIYGVLRYINGCLMKWVRRKYKKQKHRRRAEHWLGNIALS
ncbi:group II intron maturase-specific domain-containing protein [Clostridium autoethanogenum]|uniref:group II intron maturase-specific domain-containing protein n=1 Tax=Clostridium autoethanogenum TaxID=84023 RepID=UPI001FAAD11F|nr:group II intron maturase-specific domain-containing protein [Clostridium autoethanogenum]